MWFNGTSAHSPVADNIRTLSYIQFSLQIRGGSQKSLEMQQQKLCNMCKHDSKHMGRYILWGLHRPECANQPWLLLGLDKILSRTVRPYLGALSTTWCRTMTHMANVHRQLPEWWRHWWFWLALMFHRPESRLYELWCWTSTTVCPEAHWCLDPSLQGKPKDTIQMLPGLSTGKSGPIVKVASACDLWVKC